MLAVSGSKLGTLAPNRANLAASFLERFVNQLNIDSARSVFFVAGDRFECETYYESRTTINRGHITKFVAPDYFEGSLDNGDFVCGDSKALKRIPRYIGIVV